MTVITTSGNRIRLDLFPENSRGGGRVFIEVKTGPTGGLSKKQAQGIPSLATSGGLAVGERAAQAQFLPGRPIGPSRVRLIYR
jgi:hypothetical protein